MCNFGRGYHEEQFCDIILNLDYGSGSGRDGVYKISYLELWRPLCSAEGNHLCNFGRGHHGEHSCEVILTLDQWFRRRCPFKEKFMDDGQTHDGRRPITKGSGELKI